MAVSAAVRRLLRIRHLEEEQRRLALESAVGELSLLEQALDSAHRRDAQGRRLIASSAEAGEAANLSVGIEESRSAARHAGYLGVKIEDVREEVDELRALFLDTRIERRQAEMLIDQAARRQALEADRRAQQAIDDLFGIERHHGALSDRS